MVKEIIVVKKPRTDPIVDRRIVFPPLENLHLDLIENKKKLKKGLPLIVQSKKPIQHLPSTTTTPSTGDGSTPTLEIPTVVPAAIQNPDIKPPGKKPKPQKPEKPQTPEKPQKQPEKPPTTQSTKEEEKMVKELQGDDEDDEDDDEIVETDDEDDDVSPPASTPQPTPEATPQQPPPQQPPPQQTPPQPTVDDPYAGLSPEEREAKEKEEYIWRFRILKKQNKTRSIPEYTEHDDLNMMKATYETTLKDIQLDRSVDAYKTYLVGGWMAIEFISNQFLGIDMTGFARQQLQVMDKYESMLIELGEKSGSKWMMDLPVEIRLLGFIILQAGIFYVAKIIQQRGGSNILEVFYKFTGQNTPGTPANTETTTEDAPPPKKKMRGPSIKPQDIKNMADDD